MIYRFKITYVDPDSDDGSIVDEIIMIKDEPDEKSARESAEGVAYARADKGWHKVERIS